ncbi:dihydrolipoyl dehydrogenase [Reinekea sp.]|uniref:dihydrolipoyl dehydrogenase n=1 Tax=Reinekea sp. TaxID=1970455 RepID=UPI00257C2D8C|nr:dihydrolipoyl dehydrogenase [Reinekea sp.]
MSSFRKTNVVVIGAGPGGYSAAFRAADLGLDVILIEKEPTLGGVCLNVGCIPSKALLHTANLINEAESAPECGVTFGAPALDFSAITAFKDKAVSKLVSGVTAMAKQRGVQVIQGVAEFKDKHTLLVQSNREAVQIQFEHCIIAAGSRPIKLPFIPHDDPRVWDSSDALTIPFLPKKLMVIGGGIIGLEMATVYQALGSDVTITEFASQLVPGADEDLVRIYQRYNRDRFTVQLNAKVKAVDESGSSLLVTVENSTGIESLENYDAVLVAVGRAPNGQYLSAEKAGIYVDERGFIKVDDQQRTSVAHIFAIGDVVGNPMLAHKASHEGHVAAEVIAGHNAVFKPRAIPSIAYTNPEIAWVGLTEKEAKKEGVAYEIAAFPWSASGRAIGAQRSEGKTKLIYEKGNGKLLGAGIVGINAGELLGELGLALEFDADVEDIALTIHAHPTLSETVGLAGEMGAGTITDLPNAKAKPKKSA